MIFFDHDRRAERYPKALDTKRLQIAKEQINDRMTLPRSEREQTDVPPVWKQPLGRGVLNALTELSHGRCAFCETISADLRAYRFRPPAYTEPLKESEGKDSYLWLTFNWSNLYPICPNCLPQNPNAFPVDGSRAGRSQRASGLSHRPRSPDWRGLPQTDRSGAGAGAA